MDVFMI